MSQVGTGVGQGRNDGVHGHGEWVREGLTRQQFVSRS